MCVKILYFEIFALGCVTARFCIFEKSFSLKIALFLKVLLCWEFGVFVEILIIAKNCVTWKLCYFEKLRYLKTVLLWKTALLENCVALKNCVTWKTALLWKTVLLEKHCVGVRYLLKSFALGCVTCLKFTHLKIIELIGKGDIV